MASASHHRDLPGTACREVACPLTESGRVMVRLYCIPGSPVWPDGLPFRAAAGPPLEPEQPARVEFDGAYDPDTGQELPLSREWEEWLMKAILRLSDQRRQQNFEPPPPNTDPCTTAPPVARGLGAHQHGALQPNPGGVQEAVMKRTDSSAAASRRPILPNGKIDRSVESLVRRKRACA